MNKKETATILTFLRFSYPNHAEDLAQPETAEVWFRALADLDFDVVEVAATKWILTEKWPPSIADIRAAAINVTTGETVDWSEAWEMVNKAVRTIGPYREDEAMDRFDSITRETVRRMNYQTLCEMETSERDIVRAQFRDIYNQVAARSREESQIPAGLRDAIKAMQIGVPQRERITN